MAAPSVVVRKDGSKFLTRMSFCARIDNGASTSESGSRKVQDGDTESAVPRSPMEKSQRVAGEHSNLQNSIKLGTRTPKPRRNPAPPDTIAKREEMRDDYTLTPGDPNPPAEWNRPQIRQPVMTAGSSSFATHPYSHNEESQASHLPRHESWGAQRAITYPRTNSARGWEPGHWSAHHPTTHRSRFGPDAEPCKYYTSTFVSTIGYGSYAAPFGHRHSLPDPVQSMEGCSSLSYNRSSFPVQRFAARPQQRLGCHAPHYLPGNEAASTMRSGMVPMESSYHSRKKRIHSPQHEMARAERMSSRAMHTDSFKASGEWRDSPNILGSSSEISAQIEESASIQSDDAVSPDYERAEGIDTRFSDSSQSFRPTISNDSVDPAPAKSMRYSFDRSDSNQSSLELLCSAALDLGELRDNSAGCSCPKSSCIKLYCDCFKAGRRCSSQCSCSNCKNTEAESVAGGDRTKAIKNILERNPRAFTGGKKEKASRNSGDLVCNCVKSRCLKLYCDCFHEGKVCNDVCACVGCLNTQEESHFGGRRNLAIQSALEKRPDAFTKKPKEVGAGCACKNNRCLKKYCDCFRFDLSCTDKCVCRECANKVTLGSFLIESV